MGVPLLPPAEIHFALNLAPAPHPHLAARARVFQQPAAVQNAAICVGVKPPAASPHLHGSRVAPPPIGPLAGPRA